jgi:hypothetical protein
MVSHFNHRAADVVLSETAVARQGQSDTLDSSTLSDPRRFAQPRFWVRSSDVEDAISQVWSRGWLVGWRDVTASTNQRTVVPSLISRVAVGDKFLLMFTEVLDHVACLYAALCSFPLDYVARQKLGGYR